MEAVSLGFGGIECYQLEATHCYLFTVIFCCFYLGDKGEKGMLGVPGEKGKAGMNNMLILFLLISDNTPNVFSSKLHVEKKKSPFPCIQPYFHELEDMEKETFPVCTLVTFQALGKGIRAHSTPVMLTVRSKPSTSGSRAQSLESRGKSTPETASAAML